VVVTDYVGGHDPATADAGNAGAGWTLNAATGAFSGGGSGKAHAFAPVTVGAANVTGVDFGWNFDTIGTRTTAVRDRCGSSSPTRTRWAGRIAAAVGSCGGQGKRGVHDQQRDGCGGPARGEHYFVGGVATIAPASALPVISTVVVLDAQKQPGWTVAPIVEIRGMAQAPT